jgi:hypothetical protein
LALSLVVWGRPTFENHRNMGTEGPGKFIKWLNLIAALILSNKVYL